MYSSSGDLDLLRRSLSSRILWITLKIYITSEKGFRSQHICNIQCIYIYFALYICTIVHNFSQIWKSYIHNNTETENTHIKGFYKCIGTKVRDILRHDYRPWFTTNGDNTVYL